MGFACLKFLLLFSGLAKFIKIALFLLGWRWETMVMESAFLYSLGFALIFVGVLLIVVAVVLLSVSGLGKGKVKGGGAVIIGSVPIIFGTDEKSLKTVLLLALALTVMLVIAMVVYYLLLR